jgi:hypothetical protein
MASSATGPSVNGPPATAEHRIALAECRIQRLRYLLAAIRHAESCRSPQAPSQHLLATVERVLMRVEGQLAGLQDRRG